MYRQSKILRQIYLLDASFGWFSLCTLQLNWLLMCSSHRKENNRICESLYEAHDSAKTSTAKSSTQRRPHQMLSSRSKYQRKQSKICKQHESAAYHGEMTYSQAMSTTMKCVRPLSNALPISFLKSTGHWVYRAPRQER